MAEYLIYFNQQWVGDHPEEWFRSRVEPSMAVVREMQAAGVYVFAGGLEEGAPVYSADPTGEATRDGTGDSSSDASSGRVVVSDGPFTETTEVLGGFAVIDVPDDETAKMWAARLAEGCGWPQEVRRFGRQPD